jgi:hypothetical protein
MGEITLELIYRQMQAGHKELKAELAALRADVAELKETVRALSKSNVIIQRDLAGLKDRVVILTAAFGDEPPLHP